MNGARGAFVSLNKSNNLDKLYLMGISVDGKKLGSDQPLENPKRIFFVEKIIASILTGFTFIALSFVLIRK